MDSALTYQAYYTKSDPILNYMTGMLNFEPHDNILEPCGGDGVFIDKILENNPDAHVNVFELNPSAVVGLKEKYSNKHGISVKETDTLLDSTIVSCSQKYDKIIGNPPYGARNDEKKKDLLNKLYSDLYTKESYTLFLYACTRCLKENGELCFIVPDTFLSLHRHLSIRKFLLTNTQIKELALFPSSFFPGINFGYANLCIITLKKSSDISQNMNNEIVIRTNFKTVEELENTDCGTRKNISQKSVYEAVGSAFMFNSTDKIANLINNEELKKIGDIANCVTGFYSGNDKKYLHPLNSEIKNSKKYICAKTENIRRTELSQEEKVTGITEDDYLVPIVKGGNIEYIKPNHWFMDWSTQAISEYRQSKKCRFQNSDFYFKNGIGIPMIRSSKLTGALIEGRLFDQSIVGVFPKEEKWIFYLLGFFNSSVCTELINAINPSTNNSANYIKKIPFVAPCDEIKNKVDALVQNIIATLKNGDTNIEVDIKEIDEVFANLYFKNIGIDSTKSKNVKTVAKQLNFLELFDQYAGNPIVENWMVHDSVPCKYGCKIISSSLNIAKNCLISLVKSDNLEHFIGQSAKIYYTGKKFPTTIALNKLYYFVPYLKGKGIRDIYLIKKARLGFRKEGTSEEDQNDLRLVFEIEFIGQLFNDYQFIDLKIWRTFTDTTLKELLDAKVNSKHSLVV